MSDSMKFGTSLLGSTLAAWILYLLMAPPLNISSPDFWFYLIGVGIVFTLALFMTAWFNKIHTAYIFAAMTGIITITCIIIAVLLPLFTLSRQIV